MEGLFPGVNNACMHLYVKMLIFLGDEPKKTQFLLIVC